MRISPRLATSYFTISGRSFPKYSSNWLHSGVHLMKWLRLLSENSPWTTTDASGLLMNSIYPPDSDRRIRELAKSPSHEKIRSLPNRLDFNSIRDSRQVSDNLLEICGRHIDDGRIFYIGNHKLLGIWLN
jgi:hypothetical protein